VEGALRAPADEAFGLHNRWEFSDGDVIVAGRHAIRLLGGGSRYEAYLAWDDDLHSLVVVKILRPHRVDDAVTLGGLGAEARSLERLQHPVLLRCFDAVLDGPRPHLVLEFLEGPRLSTLLRRYGALAAEQLLPLALQLCSALHYMGTRAMLHLDVKPQNIIMGAPPRLIDLSVARTFDEGRKLDYPVGTDAYMAPEQCRPGDDGVGPEADMWGLGVTLYEASCGRRPWPELDDDSDSFEHRSWPQLSSEGPPALPESVPAPLAEAVHACLLRDPKERPTPSELAAALEDLVAALPRRPVLGRLKPKMR
jgi:serine/threonine protein kinase